MVVTTLMHPEPVGLNRWLRLATRAALNALDRSNSHAQTDECCVIRTTAKLRASNEHFVITDVTCCLWLCNPRHFCLTSSWTAWL